MAQALISYEDAKAANLPRYFTGIACRKGHIAERTTIGRNCVKCQQERSAKWYENNKAITVTRAMDWQRANPDRFRERWSRWAKANPHVLRRYYKERRQKFPGYYANANARRLAAELQRTPAWADLEKIDTVYELATFLTDETGEQWHVDHEIPLRGKRVSGLHVYENLRPLRASDNIRKSNKFDTTT